MQAEQAPQSYGKYIEPQVGTTFEHGNQIDLHASHLEQLEQARAAVYAATTRPLENVVEKRLEFTPLTPQEVVKMIGRKVVFDLRKGYNETHINLFDDESTPYIFSPDSEQADQAVASSQIDSDERQIATVEELIDRAEGTSKNDVDLAA